MSRSSRSGTLSKLVTTAGLVAGVGLIAMTVVRVDAAPPTTKVAVIDLEKTLYDTPAGKRASDAFDKTRKAKQGELDKKQKELQKSAAELDKQAAVLKPDVLAARKAELEKAFVTLQQTYVKLERDLAGERTKLLQEVLKQAEPIIDAMAKAEGINIVLDRSAVLWIDPAYDLTDKLNAKMK